MKTKNQSKDDVYYTVKQIVEQSGLNQATCYALLKYEHIASETFLVSGSCEKKFSRIGKRRISSQRIMNQN